MSKLVITEMDINGSQRIFSGLFNGKRFYQVDFSHVTEEQNYSVGDIYIGKVKDISKNIGAAFIEFKKGCTGYFSFAENTNIIFLNKKNTDKLCIGDEIIVQVSKAAIKTKFPVLTSNVSLTGHNVVLNVGKNGIGFSGKIKNQKFRSDMKFLAQGALDKIFDDAGEKYGVIIRTNAENAAIDDSVKEIETLISQWRDIVEKASTRTCFSMIKKAECRYIRFINGAYENEIDEIVTDNPVIFDELTDNLKTTVYGDKLRLYNDILLPLYKLYNVEGVINEVLAKRIWLKSGAYLVIENTEAMTVIDVNTGKCIKGKGNDETFYAVNIEAAKEIAFQMRLRNMSGMIMIDYINMDKKEMQKKLLEEFRRMVSLDKIKTTVVDITKLDIVEVTRKKIEPPIFEQINSAN